MGFRSHTTQEVCVAFGISRPTLKKMIVEGTIKGFKVGGHWRFRDDEVLAAMRRLEEGADA